MSVVNPICPRCGGIKREYYNKNHHRLGLSYHRVCCCGPPPLNCDYDQIQVTFSGMLDVPPSCCYGPSIKITSGASLNGTWTLDLDSTCVYGGAFDHDLNYEGCYSFLPGTSHILYLYVTISGNSVESICARSGSAQLFQYVGEDEYYSGDSIPNWVCSCASSTSPVCGWDCVRQIGNAVVIPNI